MAKSVRWRLTDDRAQKLDRVLDLFDGEKARGATELPKSQALDIAVDHLLESVENMNESADDVPARHLRKFNTSYVYCRTRTNVYPRRDR